MKLAVRTFGTPCRWQLRVIILKSRSEGRCSALKPSTDPVRPTNSSFAEFRSICSKRCSFFYYLALLFYLAYFHHTFSEQIMFERNLLGRQVNKIEFNDAAISCFISARMMDHGEIIIIMCRSNKGRFLVGC